MVLQREEQGAPGVLRESSKDARARVRCRANIKGKAKDAMVPKALIVYDVVEEIVSEKMRVSK